MADEKLANALENFMELRVAIEKCEKSQLHKLAVLDYIEKEDVDYVIGLMLDKCYKM